MAEIFICRKGGISDRSVRALRDAGVIVVQADDPSECKFIRATAEVSDSDMLWIAMKALNSGTDSYDSSAGKQRQTFAKLLSELIDARRKPPTEQAGDRS